MVPALKKAIEKAEQLSEGEQRLIAQLIVEEIGWEQTSKNSEKHLSMIAKEALEEYKKGDAKPLQL
jgi:hypothetical protein